MAGFPVYEVHETFETGADGDFESGADNDKRLFFMHISQLAQSSAFRPTPLRGAYAMVIDARYGQTADAYLKETTSLDVTSGAGDLYYAFSFLMTPDMEANHGDVVTISSVDDGSASKDGEVIVRYTDTFGWQVCITENAAEPDDENAYEFEPGEWVHVAVKHDVETSNGTMQFWINGESAGKGLTGVSNGTGVAEFRIGCEDQSSTMKGGMFVFDEIVGDFTDRQRPLGEYDAEEGLFEVDPISTGRALVTQNGHVAIGGGALKRVVIGGGTPTNPVELYETDRGQRYENTYVTQTKETIEWDDPIEFERGIYVYCSSWDSDQYVFLEFEPDIDDREELGEYAVKLEKPGDDD